MTKTKLYLIIAGAVVTIILTIDPQPNHKTSPGFYARQRAQEHLEEIQEMERQALADKMFGRGNHY